MTPRERKARSYCLTINADPDELVWGYFLNNPERVQAPRWCWYVEDTTHPAYGS
jgi:hypothetical protein